MKLPEPNNSIQSLIDKHHESQQEKPRHHLGCSLLGHPCDRYLWLSFRWAVIEDFPGRILRLFRRGQNEESTVVSDLRAIGMHISNTGLNQSRVEFGSHVSGSLDGVIEFGVPEAPKAKHILEIKTNSKRTFDDLEKKGVEKSKFQHFVQMQIYMMGKKIDRALYVAVCKDDDRIYTERVRLDKDIANKYIERGHRIALSDRMPETISADPSWYQCKFCAAHSMCHKAEPTKQVNCRTCAHSTAKEDDTWLCEKWNDSIPKDVQYEGCEFHVIHPDVVPYKMVDSKEDGIATYIIEGKAMKNGKRGGDVFSSKELISDPHSCVTADKFIMDTRKSFDAEITSWD